MSCTSLSRAFVLFKERSKYKGDEGKVVVQMLLFVRCLTGFRWSMGPLMLAADLDRVTVDQRLTLEKCLSQVGFEAL